MKEDPTNHSSELSPTFHYYRSIETHDRAFYLVLGNPEIWVILAFLNLEGLGKLKLYAIL